MNWRSYIVPQTIARETSPHNSDIRVQVTAGRMRLLVNGIEQSGPEVRKFWDFAFSELAWPERADSILVLGVGGGTVIRMLSQRYPEAAITAVDVDGKIVRLAKRYFGLDSVPSLRLVVSDAGRFVQSSTAKYDLIVSDLYVGREIPGLESSQPFIRRVRRRLKAGGTFVINFLHDGSYGERSERFRETLSREFARVISADLPYNRFFLAV